MKVKISFQRLLSSHRLQAPSRGFLLNLKEEQVLQEIFQDMFTKDVLYIWDFRKLNNVRKKFLNLKGIFSYLEYFLNDTCNFKILHKVNKNKNNKRVLHYTGNTSDVTHTVFAFMSYLRTFYFLLCNIYFVCYTTIICPNIFPIIHSVFSLLNALDVYKIFWVFKGAFIRAGR